MDIDDLYTPLEVAKNEIWERWNNKVIKEDIINFLNEDIPEFMQNEPKAFFNNPIVSPNYDYFSFMKGARKAELIPVCTEFLDDKFVVINPIKSFLGRLRFYSLDSINNRLKVSGEFYDAIGFVKSEGKKISQVMTLWGEKLYDFHHRILYLIAPESQRYLIDFSPWLRRNGRGPIDYYFKFLSLFISHGIMFENFLSEGNEGKFTRNIVLPSLSKVTKFFGLKPLIVTLEPVEIENNIPWGCYQESFRHIIKEAIYKK